MIVECIQQEMAEPRDYTETHRSPASTAAEPTEGEKHNHAQ
jgi:hypothetical protein